MATDLIGTGGPLSLVSQSLGKHESRSISLPSRRVFIPRPECLSFLHMTSIEPMKPGFRRCSCWRALREVALKWSEPQKRMRSGGGKGWGFGHWWF